MQVLEVLQKLGYNPKEIGADEFQMLPLYRPSDNSTALVVKKSTGQFYDFVTKEGGSLSKLVKITLGLPTIDSARDFLGENFKDFEVKYQSEITTVKKFDKNILLRLVKDYSYWNGRGISNETLELFQGGVANTGKLKDRFVFPIFDNNDLIGFAGRSIINDNKRWKLLGSKKNWVYPLFLTKDEIIAKKEAIIIESVGDALSLWSAGIKNFLICFGITIFPKMIETLLKLDVRKVIIAFNNDSDGSLAGNDAAEEERGKLLKFFDSNQVMIALPTENDFGVTNIEKIKEWYARTQ